MQGRVFRSSSMAEHSAVNRRVVGSSPTCGARDWTKVAARNVGGLFVLPRIVRNGPEDQKVAECSSQCSVLSSNTRIPFEASLCALLSDDEPDGAPRPRFDSFENVSPS
jgi:hypothetical protein